MADNISTTAGTFASDDIGGIHYERLKLVLGADGVNDGDVHSSNPMPTTLVSSMVSIGGGTQYVDGNTTTLPTGTVMLWKSAVSTLVPASTSNPFPVSTLPMTANLGTISSIATQATLSEISTYTASSVSLLSSNKLRLETISTVTNSSNTLLINLSSNTASSIALQSTIAARLNPISTLALQATLAQISTYTQSTANMLGGSLASSSGAFWVQSVPGSAQTTVSNTVLIRTGIYDANNAQITSFGGGTQYVEGNTTTAPTGTVMLWKAAVSTLQAASTSNPMPMHMISTSVAIGGGTQYVEGNTTTAPTGNVLIWKSAVSTMSAASTSNPLPIHMISTSVAIGGGTQYVDGNTTTAPTGTVMMWKSAVSTIVPVTSSQGLPVNVIAGSLNANTEYIDGATTTLPTGIVMLWKSAVSTLVPASTSNPFPISSLPLTANIGTISSLATQATLAEVTTYTASSVSLLSTVAARVTLVSSLGLQATLAEVTTYTASTVSLASTIALRLNPISTLGLQTTLAEVTTYTASSVSLLSSNKLRLENISTFTNSSNTLLIQVSSNTASSNALLSTVSARLAPVPTGIYVQPVAVSSNGLQTFRTLDADETEEEISATPCTVYGMWVTNTSSATAYIKLYNGTSSAIHTSSSPALITIGIPGNSTDDVSGVFNVGGMGISFSTACCIAAGTSAADVSTVPGESSVICNVFYKA